MPRRRKLECLKKGVGLKGRKYEEILKGVCAS